MVLMNMVSRVTILVLLLLCIFVTSSRSNGSNFTGSSYTQFLLLNGVARTPPMGWNSWNSLRCGVNEKNVKATADALISSGLAALGYKYVNIDDCWGESNRDSRGNLKAKSSAFPSGMKALADYMHARGLKLGIYSDAGYSACSTTMPGSLGNEEQDAKTFAEWGIDYLKYDNCYNDGSRPEERYAAMGYALHKAGRPILYSLCEWGQDDPAKWAGQFGNAWRTTGDTNNTYQSVMKIADLNNIWGRYAGPGRWNDPDMLGVGIGGMSLEEYRSHFSIWAAMKAPLLIGCDVRSASRETLAILGNKEVVGINQDSLGAQARKIRSKSGLEIWAGVLSGKRIVVVLWNRSESAATITVSWRDLGLLPYRSVIVRDVWTHSFVSKGMRFRLSANVVPHGCKMYIFTPM